jgi:glycerol uptake facilitator protein
MNPIVAEFVGTVILILFGNGVVANVVLNQTKGNGSGWIVITFGWGMGVFVAVFCTSRFSGAHLSPAVTVALAVAGKFPWGSVLPYCIAQLGGAFVGASLIWLFYREHFAITPDGNAKLACFCTAPNIRAISTALFCEIVGTFMLVFPIFLMSQPSLRFDHGTAGSEGALPGAQLGLGAIGALPVGLLVFAIGLSLGGTTGYAINPARDLGPRLAHAVLPIPNKRDSDWGYAWVPIVGPLIGAIIGGLAARCLS